MARGEGTAFDLWTVPLQSSPAGLQAGTPEIFLRTSSFEVHPSFSPDGRRIAFGSNVSGRWEVYVRAFPDNGRQVQLSRNGGRVPVWAGTRNTLLYQEDLRMMAVDFEVRGDVFTAKSPREWSPQRLADTGVIAGYDVAADGARVLGLVPAEAPSQGSGLVLISSFLDRIEPGSPP